MKSSMCTVAFHGDSLVCRFQEVPNNVLALLRLKIVYLGTANKVTHLTITYILLEG